MSIFSREAVEREGGGGGGGERREREEGREGGQFHFRGRGRCPAGMVIGQEVAKA